MDTSAHSAANKVLGHEAVPYDSIPVEGWMRILNEIYRDPRVLLVPGLFQTIGDLMSGNDVFIGRAPRDLTRFHQGIGVNTWVRRAPFRERKRGRILTGNVQEFETKSFLLLIRPEEGRNPTWGQLDLNITYFLQDAPKEKHTASLMSTVTSASVYLLTEHDVQWIFSENKASAVFLSDIHCEVELCAQKLAMRALDLTHYSSWVQGIMRRLRTSS